MKLRLLTDSPEDLRQVKELLGRPGDAAAKLAKLLKTEIPRRQEDRFIVGAFAGECLSGIADVNRACPDRTTALIESFLPNDRVFFLLLEELIRGWAGMKRVLLGPELIRFGAADFWEPLGFKEFQKEVEPLKRRHFLKAPVLKREVRVLEGWVPRVASPADAVALGVLMDRSFRGTIDDEGETVEQFTGEMKETMRGKYGAFIREASFVVPGPEGLVAASLVTIWNELPLLAFSATDPAFQSRGLGELLIRLSMNRMAELGYRELNLGVTEGNRSAQRLYSKLGFV